MINEQVFRIRKNGKPYSNCLCTTPNLIENYDKAIADKTQTWICHHRLETYTSDGERRFIDIRPEELIALDMYFHRPPNELIFLTKEEHNTLHSKGKKPSVESRTKMSMAAKSVKHTQEWNKKVGESQKKYWYNVSSEEREKRAKTDSEAQKKWWDEHPEAKVKSEETRRRMSEAAKKREAAKRLAKARTQTQENCEE